MNKNRRARLSEAEAFLRKAQEIVSGALDEENDCMNSLPEGLGDSEKYERMEAASDNLDSALYSIGEALDCIDRARE